MTEPGAHSAAGPTTGSGGDRLFEGAVLGFYLLNLLSYPFYVKFIALGAYQALYLLCYGLMLALLAVRPSPRVTTRDLAQAPGTAVFLLAYGAYVAVLLLASLPHAGSPYVFPELVRLCIKLSVAAVLFLFFPFRGMTRALDLTTTLVTLAAAAALLLQVLAMAGAMAPIAEIEFPSQTDDWPFRTLYPLGYVWQSLELPGGVQFFRLQSFSDEPGTFAFALLPAIAWAVHRRRRASALLMAAALLPTLSAGAITLFLLLVLAYLVARRRYGAILLLFACLLGVGLLFDRLPYSDVAVDYAMKRIGGEGRTSFGDRLGDLRVLLDAVSRHPGGFGVGGLANRLEVALAIGWLRPLAESGWARLVTYSLSLGLLVVLAARRAFAATGLQRVLGVILLINFVASLQRARMDESVWHWLAIAAFLRGELLLACREGALREAEEAPDLHRPAGASDPSWLTRRRAACPQDMSALLGG